MTTNAGSSDPLSTPRAVFLDVGETILDETRMWAARLRVGLVGNQPSGVEDALRELGLRADVVASSGTWGVEKPDPAFFARVVESAGVPAAEICYVGDRVDNDILPAAAAGMVTAFLRRGPWGLVHAAWPEAERADIRLDSLDQLLPALRAL